MNTPRLGCFALLVSAAATLPACSVSQSPIGAGATPQSAIGKHGGRSGSWMLSEAAAGKSTLLYAGNTDGNTVSVYGYESGELVGTLTGFNFPSGGCVDASGDVFIANQGDGNTLEFKNGATKPIHRYHALAAGVGCSIDRNGDLAVAVQPISTSKQPLLCVWKAGQKSNSCFTVNGCSNISSPGYDQQGNLYVEGSFAICELPAGANAVKPVKLSGGTIRGPAGVMWDGSHLTLSNLAHGSVGTTRLYRVEESASGDLTIVGTTVLTDTCRHHYATVNQPFIVGKKNTPINDREGKVVVGANAVCAKQPIDAWKYPNGGNPLRSWPQDFHPGGVVVSIGS